MIGRVLVIDDEQSMCELAQTGLEQRGFSVTWRTSAEQAFELLETEDFDAVLTDLNLGELSGIELCARVAEQRPDLPTVVMTAFGSLEGAIGAIRAGAYDFVTKPVAMDALALTLERAIQHKKLRAELKRLQERVGGAALANVTGDSPAMKEVANLVARVASSDANVLITGESGTGKELIARALHDQSGRAGPFLAINCAAVPETLLESELFGHARGAFTDARAARKGLFVEANGGTLFLDEIGEMPMGMQAKILRALQERKVRPVGESVEVPFDARLVAATNRDLESEVADRRFREDLFYRINVVRIHVPPLRARGNDILLLAKTFLERAAERSGKGVTRIGNAVAERLLSYNWPGNVRELENCVERAVALARFDEIRVDDLPEKIRDHSGQQILPISNDPDEMPTMAEVEERYIQSVLKAVGGNKTLAARVLGFDRRTLYRKLERIFQVATN
jgi:DNA-binding NtrC family response regulator